MSRFTAHVAAGLARARAYAGEPAVYDDGTTAESVTAIRGQLQDDQDELLAALNVERRVVDWLIAAADLNGVPKAGDTITAAGVVYEVVHLTGQPPWRWSDPGRTQYRIHTQETDDAE